MPDNPDISHDDSGPGEQVSGGPRPSTAGFLARTSAILAGATMLSRLLGLVRDMLMAHFYGAGGQTDSFAFAIVVPELLRTLIISGAVASVFIPLMTETQRSGKPEQARKLAGMMISFITLIALVVVLLGEVFSNQLVGASQLLRHTSEALDPEKAELTAELIRILLPIVLFVGLWGLMGGILNALDNFHVPGLAPLAWNGTIIVILIVFGKQEIIQHLAWAYVIGHGIQVLVHIPALIKEGILPVAIDWKHPMLRKFLILAPAALLAYAAPAVNAFIGQGIALNMEESAASSLMYAFRVQQLPMSVFGVSVAVAIFPTLSRYSSSGSGGQVVRTLASGLRMTTLAVLPAVVFFLILNRECIELIYQRGKFDAGDTINVSTALFWYSWAILPASLLLLTARTFFSGKDTRTPALLGIVTIIVFYILAVLLTGRFGFQGLPISNSIVAWIFLIVSIFIIYKRYVNDESLLKCIGLKSPLQMLTAGIIEAGVLLIYSNLVGEIHGAGPLVIYIIGGMILGAGVYLGFLKMVGNPDLGNTIGKLFRRS